MRVTSVVFDLDDTLYLERDYVRSGIKAVGAWLAERTSCLDFATTATRLWDAGQRDRLFDETLRRLNIAPEPRLVAELVEVYRGHEPSITLADDAAEYLARPGGRRLALVTDGIASAQRRKIAALRLDRFAFEPIIPTGDLGSGFQKPHRRAFEAVAAAHRVPPEATVYVADNPAKDFLAPRALGWRTVQIDRPGAVHCRTSPSPAHSADICVTSLADLDAALERLAYWPS